MFNEIKWFIQRGRRGYSDMDTWSFSSYLSEIIPPVVRKMKGGHGCPSELYDKDALNNECHKWSEILEEIAQGFEAVRGLENATHMRYEKREDGHWEHMLDQQALDNFNEKAERGLALFSKWFQALWD